MRAVFLSSLGVLFLRCGPQVFPRSRLLFLLVLAPYFLTDMLDDWLQGYSLTPNLLDSFFDTGSWLLLIALLLGIRSVLPRLLQTLTAWYGAGVLLNFVSLPVLAATKVFTGSDAQQWLGLAGILLAVWSIMVLANLLYHALRTGYAIALVLAVICVSFNMVLSLDLFPVV